MADPLHPKANSNSKFSIPILIHFNVTYKENLSYNRKCLEFAIISSIFVTLMFVSEVILWWEIRRLSLGLKIKVAGGVGEFWGMLVDNKTYLTPYEAL